jgi:LCP family protein required for cell wall assembly
MMTFMNVLPFGMLILFYVVLGLLSIIIVMQLRKDNVRKGIRALAGMTAVLLIAGFGVGTAYAMGTLSFLDFTSVTNAKKVAAITKEPFNVCISGIDVRGTIDEQGRSDVNMVVTVNPKTEQILMTSIPRDYEIYMPDKDNAMDKLTHTGFYSVDTTIGAEENLLDTQINYFVKVNFTTVMMFIDAVGGIDVYSEYEFYPVKRDWWKVEKGWNHMNGREALAFARERKAFIDGDNQRIKNQQAVFEAIIKKATSSKTMLLSYNKILANLKEYFQMSFSSGELRSLLKLQLAKNPQWKIYKNTIVGGNGSMPTYSTGNAYAYVMTQDQESIDNAKTLINAVLEGKMLEKDDDGKVTVVAEEEGGENGESEGE